MSKFTIELINPSLRIAMHDFEVPDAASREICWLATRDKELRLAKQTWMDPSNEIQWFDRNNAGHIAGVLLDENLRVVIKRDGEVIDSFKAFKTLYLCAVSHVYRMFPIQRGMEEVGGRMSGMELFEDSVYTADLPSINDPDVFDRLDLMFDVAKVTGVYHTDTLHGYKNMTYTEVYAITSVKYKNSEELNFSVSTKGSPKQWCWSHIHSLSYEPSADIDKRHIKRFTKKFISNE